MSAQQHEFVLRRGPEEREIGLGLEDWSGGVVLTEVVAGTVADRAGCGQCVGHFMLAIAGHRVASSDDVQAAVMDAAPGADVVVVCSAARAPPPARMPGELRLRAVGEDFGVEYEAMSSGDIEVQAAAAGRAWAQSGLPVPCILCSIQGQELRCAADVTEAVKAVRAAGLTVVRVETLPTWASVMPPGWYRLLLQSDVFADLEATQYATVRSLPVLSSVEVAEVQRYDGQLRGRITSPAKGWIPLWDLAAGQELVQQIDDASSVDGRASSVRRQPVRDEETASRRPSASRGPPTALEVLALAQAARLQDPAAVAVAGYTAMYSQQVVGMASPPRARRAQYPRPHQLLVRPPRQVPPQAQRTQTGLSSGAASSALGGGGGGGGGSLQAAAMHAHNELRQQHGAPPLRFSEECRVNAARQAQHCADSGALGHGHKDGQGQNCAFMSGPVSDAEAVRRAAQMWYDEIRDWRPGGGFSAATGHFTQLVWRATAALGVAVARDARGSVYVVANYVPPGNVRGQFGANVQA
eukprot:TRINITY_DN5932_c0_g1_i2.p1 TRINITY_DN5932_c0_g1~~TRINITY_DN5932_c0_g1_i2.p1  ORF type:complete len:525 (+),score=167.60 TRINITY_DN5932_c0_g1_i2:60-1634(+)